jgi:hypothetical protein
MKPVSTEAGQALQLAVMDEVRPLRGGPFWPDVITKIAQRYRFVSPVPTDPAQPAKFQVGVLELNDMTIPIISLEIYNDGIVVNARHTDDADAVMDDFVAWSMATLQLRESTTKIPRQYVSQVIVDLDGELNMFMRNFDALSSVISKAFGTQHTLHISRLAIGTEPIAGIPLARSTWQIEPRIGQPIASNCRYFSTAPIPTSAHFDLLATLEATVMERG